MDTLSKRFGALIAALGTFGCVAPSHAASTSNTLVITAPTAGTVVRPGQLLTVKVTATGTYPTGVAIVGGSPTLTSQGFQSGPNLTFSVTIPQRAKPGPFRISAVGANSAGALVTSEKVVLNVERAETPQSISVEPARIQFDFIGDSLSVDVYGTFADGSELLMTDSSLLQISSTDPKVAIVKDGFIVAAGPGSTAVTFSVGAATQSVQVTVPTSARGDLNLDGRIDKSDVDILDSALNTPAMIVNDARDLKPDGQITTADRTILQSLCRVQSPLCATY